jgi:hypothetical protein
MAGFGNSGVPPTIQSNMNERRSIELKEARQLINFDVWNAYCGCPNRSLYVASTPHAEAASILVSNCDALVSDIQKQQSRLRSTNSNYVRYLEALPTSTEELEDLVFDLSQLLMDTGSNKLVEPDFGSTRNKHLDDVACLAAFLDERMCVPRDMGSMPAACIKLIGQRHMG